MPLIKNFFHFYAQIFLKNFDRFFKFINFHHFWQQFTNLKQSFQKKITFYNVRLEKRKILSISLFWFSNFCHTTFLMIGGVIFNFLKNDNIGNIRKCLASFLYWRKTFQNHWLFATNVFILVFFFTHILINWQFIPEKSAGSLNQENLVHGHFFSFLMSAGHKAVANLFCSCFNSGEGRILSTW